MKLIYTLLMGIIMTNLAFAQTKLNKSYQVKNAQVIELDFDYPKIVKVSTWDKNEVSIIANISVDEGDASNSFSLRDSIVDGKLSIKNKIDWDKVPTLYFVEEDGKKTKFESKEDFENYKKNRVIEKGSSYYQQRNLNVQMEVKVPASSFIIISSTYGMVELLNFNGQAKIDAKYGGVDASLEESKIGKIKLTNRYGKIYSNLTLTPTEKTDQNFFTSITAEPGKGPSYEIASSYGNIYLRKKI